MVTTGRAASPLVPAMVTVAVFTGPTVYAAAGARLTTMLRSGFTTVLRLRGDREGGGGVPGGERDDRA